MPLALSIVTPDGPIAEIAVDSVVAPGGEGEFGVLPGHENFLAPLVPGVLSYQSDAGAERLVITEGFAEVTPDRVSILVSAAEPVEKVDRARAEAAHARALERLEQRLADDELDEQRARSSLARAKARLSVI